ncbi:MAG: hypothetical protein BMS9Abin23_0661 [Thermodesulfobacteriota bacterium]|nr:MAG: hypothetical protein BMS9Abin23_0661 [Thermodesulfobacteriota bacterium]
MQPLPELSKKIFSSPRGIALTGVIIAVIFWLYESYLHPYIFRMGSGANPVWPRLHAQWLHVVIVSIIIFFSFYVQFAVIRLREAKQRLKNYMDVSGTVFVALDEDCKVSFINRYGCEVLGYGEEDVLGRDWCANFLPERLREDMAVVFNSLKSGREGAFEFHENHIVTRGGEERFLLWHNAVLRDSRGKFTGTVSSGMDITDKRRMEEKLREKLLELERFRKATVDREFRIREMKEENIRLKAESAGPDSFRKRVPDKPRGA